MFANLGFLLATCMWSLGWIAATALAAQRVSFSRDVASVVALMLAWIFALMGTAMVIRMIARAKAAAPQPSAPKEPWLRRTTGWFAGIVWGGVAVAWNVGIIGWQLKMAHAGRGWFMLILVPWSLIGWFLMGVLFVELGVVIDSAIGIFQRGNQSSGESWK